MTTELTVPPCWQDFADVLSAGLDRAILYGPPGTGKTHAGLHYGVPAHKTGHRLICNEDMTDSDIRGHFKPTANGTWEWHEGAVIKAWKQGSRVVADEIDKSSGDVLSILLSMFDTPESASWTNTATGEVVTPQEGFSVVMTTNIETMSDLPTALVDRFPVAIRINAPHPDALLCLSEDLRVPASLSADADSWRRISMRGWQAFDKARKYFVMEYGRVGGEERAAKLIFGERANAILDTIRVNSVA